MPYRHCPAKEGAKRVHDGQHVRVVEMESNDAWMRDMGPSFVIDSKGALRAVDWTFNAWGGLVDGLYFPWDADDKIARKVCEIEGVFGGGSIHCITQQVPRP